MSVLTQWNSSDCRTGLPRARRGAAGPATPQVDLEPEDGAPLRPAGDADGAAHDLHQLLGDRETQAGAAVLPRGGAVRLGERIEDFRRDLGSDADAGVP